MMRALRIIKVIGHLLQNAIMRRSKYDLAFPRKDDRVWYALSYYFLVGCTIVWLDNIHALIFLWQLLPSHIING
jgi:hypothetical protein